MQESSVECATFLFSIYYQESRMNYEENHKVTQEIGLSKTAKNVQHF